MIRVTKAFLLLTIIVSPLLGEKSCYYSLFSPPSDWQVAKPDTLSPWVKIGFFDTEKKRFPPSINLAEESTKANPFEYLKKVKQIYESEANTKWSNLGIFQTDAGTGFLTLIDTKVNEDDVRILQFVLIKNQVAYLLTSACTKKDFPKRQAAFFKAFQSLQLTRDLKELVENNEKKSRLEKITEEYLSSQRSWRSFQNLILKEFEKQGTCWQLLFLDSIRRKNPS